MSIAGMTVRKCEKRRVYVNGNIVSLYMPDP